MLCPEPTALVLTLVPGQWCDGRATTSFQDQWKAKLQQNDCGQVG